MWRPWPQKHGSQRATTAGVGEWRSLAFRGFVEAILDISRPIARLLIDDGDPDSIGDEKPISYTNMILTQRNSITCYSS